MRSSVATVFSLILIGMGLLTVVWVSTSMIGIARSQTQPMVAKPEEIEAAMKAANSPGAPAQYQIPSAQELEAENAKLAAEQAAQIPPPEPQMAVPPPPTMDMPPPSVGMPLPIDTPVMGAPPSQTEAFVAGIQNAEGYTYDPSGRRDPFRPFGQSQVVVPVPSPIPIPAQQAGVPQVLQPPTALAPTEPLQQYDLAQLKIVGIVWEVRNPKAMVKDPLGKLHLIRKEAKIGRNNGFVAAIREGEVVVVEPAYGEGGVQTAITRTMSLIR